MTLSTFQQNQNIERHQDFYSSLLTKKRNWTPISPSTAGEVTIGSETTLQKVLALAKLELPVAGWISDEYKKIDLVSTSELDNLLRSNIEDETKHDQALNNLKAIFPTKTEYEDEVDSMIDRANQLADLYSPVTLTAVIESSIFFVLLPMLRFMGDVSMRTVANDISLDENVHVSTNLQLASDLGHRRGKALNTFREDVIEWLVSDLSDTSDNKYLTKEFWSKSSYSLYHKGTATELSATTRASMPAFFEINNQSISTY